MSDNEQISYADESQDTSQADPETGQPAGDQDESVYEPTPEAHEPVLGAYPAEDDPQGPVEPTPIIDIPGVTEPVHTTALATGKERQIKALPKPEWMTPPEHLKGRKRELWIATKYAEAKEQRLTIKVELPELTKVMKAVDPNAEPFVVTVRAQTIQDMIAAGEVPNHLKEEIEAFNTSLAAFIFEEEQREGESEERFTKRGMASVIRETGVMDFNARQKETRDITVCICSVEPKIRVSAYDCEEDDMSLDQLSDGDISAIYEAIQKATGEVTEAELKSVVDEAAATETPDELVVAGERDQPAAIASSRA